MGEPARSRRLREIDVAAPGHHRGRQSDAEVGQRGLGDDECPQRDGGHRDHRTHRVGQRVAQQGLKPAQPQCLSREHIVAGSHLQHRAASDPGHLRPAEQGQDGDHRPHRAVVHDLHQHDRGQQQRQPEEHVGDTRDHRVDPAPVEAGQRAQRPADDEHQQRGAQPDRDRGPRPVDGARVDVVALQVGAEPVRCRRGEQALAGVGVAGIGAGEQRRKQRDDER